MHKLLLTIGLVAGLSACGKHDAKVQQADPAQTASAPVPDQTAQPVTQATNPATPTPAPAYSASTEPNGIAPAQQAAAAPPIAIPAGTQIRVRMEQTVDTRRNRAGDRFEATLISPILVDRNVLVPRGTPFEGHVTEAKHSGRFKGRAVLSLKLDSFRMNGTVYQVATASDTRVSGRHRKRNWILIGGGSGFGATVGAAAAGGPGALIGAGAGAGAGAVGAFFTGRKDVRLPVETALTFRIRTDVALGGG
jgi:hypothetical protein